ncbi:hypothetical protein P873_14575 [Arenimonas composti TR7-09 = DSM 18010]|uniref:Uncharacterized protein n=1 Tax=Arenimonas composti TR7-09 = DSM 18010 TaxID=1121013 RepID=A0A091B6T2_9GAMM|nr:hypothetical protein P873_14575 [Arenimonas composti TR7-09 = DSM 18010]
METGNPQVFALEVTRSWLDLEGGRQRIPSALRQLLEATLDAVARGQPPPEKDSSTLTDLGRLSREGAETGATTPLKGGEVKRWWAARQARVSQLCADRQCEWVPELVVRTGGGRNLQTQFSFALERLVQEPAELDEEGPGDPSGLLRYRIDPAKAAWWVRLFLGTHPFPMRSWRGYLLVGSTILNFLLVALVWLAIYVSWSRGRPVTTADLALFGASVAFTVCLWMLSKPMWRLPKERVTLAGVGFLATDELHGQLRTMRDETRADTSRVFSIVRHWGHCPICAAEVDLDEGGLAFSDRLIGRCHDAPLEHIFSFDPVLLTDEPLRKIIKVSDERAGHSPASNVG